jgi:hypothetical protein
VVTNTIIVVTWCAARQLARDDDVDGARRISLLTVRVPERCASNSLAQENIAISALRAHSSFCIAFEPTTAILHTWYHREILKQEFNCKKRTL